MRSLAGLIVASLLSSVVVAKAEPTAAPGYELKIVQHPGAVYAGLARDGESLLVTDIAAGRFFRIDPDDHLLAFGPTLPHGLDVMGDPTGPYRVERWGNGYIVAQGWTPVGAEEVGSDHALLEVNDTSLVKVISNDFWNPYDFVVANDDFYVIDAARNSVERLSAEGTKQTLFTFAQLTASTTALEALSPTEFNQSQDYKFDAVPTGIAMRNDRLYVSLFGGFPFIAGSGRIVSLPAIGISQSARIEVSDLNSPVDVVFDGRGDMIVLEHGLFDQSSGFAAGTGRLIRISPTGERQVILEGLTRPVAVLNWDERTLVVSELGERLYFLTIAPNASAK